MVCPRNYPQIHVASFQGLHCHLVLNNQNWMVAKDVNKVGNLLLASNPDPPPTLQLWSGIWVCDFLA